MAVQRTREQRQQRQIGDGTGLYTWSSPAHSGRAPQEKPVVQKSENSASTHFLADMKKTLFAFLACLFMLATVFLLQR